MSVVISIDEKPLQALERIHPTKVDPRDGALRHEYEYRRKGTQSLLGAFEVGTGLVLGRVVPKRSADALVAFMEAWKKLLPSAHLVDGDGEALLIAGPEPQPEGEPEPKPEAPKADPGQGGLRLNIGPRGDGGS